MVPHQPSKIFQNFTILVFLLTIFTFTSGLTTIQTRNLISLDSH